jgi:hypothetical protein
MSVDLPTLGFPMILTNPDLCSVLLGKVQVLKIEDKDREENLKPGMESY